MIKNFKEENKYKGKGKMNISQSVHGRNAILNEIHNMRMRIFDDR